MILNGTIITAGNPIQPEGRHRCYHLHDAHGIFTPSKRGGVMMMIRSHHPAIITTAFLP